MAPTDQPAPAEHEITGRHYPGEWARQIELYLDRHPRRILLYGGLFGMFVLGILVALVARIAV